MSPAGSSCGAHFLPSSGPPSELLRHRNALCSRVRVGPQKGSDSFPPYHSSHPASLHLLLRKEPDYFCFHQSSSYLLVTDPFICLHGADIGGLALFRQLSLLEWLANITVIIIVIIERRRWIFSLITGHQKRRFIRSRSGGFRLSLLTIRYSATDFFFLLKSKGEGRSA